MKSIGQDFAWFLRQRLYVAFLSLTALCCYGFEITHYSIGVDDTALGLYFEDGLAVVMGRWVLFLLNRLFPLSEFVPFFWELVGVLLLMAGVTLFCVLLRRILGDRLGIVGYTLFACVFVSNPIMTEVYYYSLHNGVDLGYGLTALALLFYLDFLRERGRGRYLCLAVSGGFLWVALGCYESFAILYLVGILAILLLQGIEGRLRLTLGRLAGYLCMAAVSLACCIVARSLTVSLLTYAFDLYDVRLIGYRSISEMSALFTSEGWGVLAMLLKRYLLVYYINGAVYLPVAGYVSASLVLGLCSLGLAWRRKTPWYPVVFAGMQLAPVLMTVIEAELTKYRSCQYLPFVTALGAVVLYLWASGKRGKLWTKGAALAVGVLAMNQAACTNNYFYKEYLKYRDARETMLSVAYEVERRYGRDMPVIFCGRHYTPYGFMEEYFAGYGSREFQLIAAVTDLVDENLKEKYYSEYGYRFDGEASFSVIDWGIRAFDDTNRELIQFLRMHGHPFESVTDLAVLEEAAAVGAHMSSWPQAGSVAEWNGYVLVHLEE